MHPSIIPYAKYVRYASYLMTMTDGMKMGIMDLRKALGQRIEAAFFHGEPTYIEHEKRKEVRAVLVPPAWVTELEELRAFKRQFDHDHSPGKE